MGRVFATLKSFFRQPLSFLNSLRSPASKPSLSRDASLSLEKLNTKVSRQLYTNNDPLLRSFIKKHSKRNLKMSKIQAGLNPEASAFADPGPEEPADQLKAQTTEAQSSTGKSKKKKKGKKLKQHAIQQEVRAECNAPEAQTDGFLAVSPPQPQEKRKPGHTDKKVDPSAASGGVPEPSQNYIISAVGRPNSLPAPRPILIVMDLNGTILHRPANRNNTAAFVERPHANRFMQYCLDTFHVAIWSSARPKNVNNMVRKLLTPEQVEKCVLIWSRDQLGLSAEDYNLRVQCYKRLERVWEDPRIQASCPEGVAKWDQSNTVLVDDSYEKGRSEPFNILALPEFASKTFNLELQHVLPQVHDYLNQLAWQEDVSRYMRAQPFKLDPAYKLPNIGI